jgi:hypothetical protein
VVNAGGEGVRVVAKSGEGKRGIMRKTAAELASNAPNEMREHLAPYVGEFCEALMRDLRDPESVAHRTALGLYAQILGAVGGAMSLTVNLWQRFGAQDEGHAARLIGTALDAEGMDLDAAWRLSEQFVQDYRRQHGMPELVEASAPASRVDAVGGPSVLDRSGASVLTQDGSR